MKIVLEPRTLRFWILLSMCWLFLYACSKNCPPGYELNGGYCTPRDKDAGVSQADAAVSGGGRSGRDSSPAGVGGGGGGDRSSAANGGGGGDRTGMRSQGVGSSPDAGPGADAATADAGSDAVAMDAVDPCDGHADETICVQAVMHHCGAKGMSSMPETCTSAMLCQVGKASGTCAVCNPGTYRCDGAQLNHCTDAGQYELAMTCPSVALCKESGACTDMLCKPNEKQCASDGTLKTCNADGSAFIESQNQVCGKDMCDAKNAVCFACVPSSITCNGSTAASCAADGQKMTATECKAASDCSAVSCVEGTGCSAATSLPAKTKCTSAGGQQCDGAGQCVGCVDDSVCGDKKCGSNKTCVQCTAASDCPGKSDCVDPICSSAGTCSTAPASALACVDDQGNRGSCTAGRCVCSPSCSGKCAGDNGCGGTCPNTCSADQMCQSNVCVATPTGHKLYEACNPGADLQGDCQTALACVGIGGRGYHCYYKPPCGSSAVEVFGMICAQYCLAPDSTTPACPVDASYCFANGDTADQTDGYCIP